MRQKTAVDEIEARNVLFLPYQGRILLHFRRREMGIIALASPVAQPGLIRPCMGTVTVLAPAIGAK